MLYSTLSKHINPRFCMSFVVRNPSLVAITELIAEVSSLSGMDFPDRGELVCALIEQTCVIRRSALHEWLGDAFLNLATALVAASLFHPNFRRSAWDLLKSNKVFFALSKKTGLATFLGQLGIGSGEKSIANVLEALAAASALGSGFNHVFLWLSRALRELGEAKKITIACTNHRDDPFERFLSSLGLGIHESLIPAVAVFNKTVLNLGRSAFDLFIRIQIIFQDMTMSRATGIAIQEWFERTKEDFFRICRSPL